MEKAKVIWQKSIVVLFCQLTLVFLMLGFSGVALGQEASKIDLLFTNISKYYEKSSGAWQVMELNACGLGDIADKRTLLAETVSAVKGGPKDITQLQRNIIALTAAGYNCTALPDGIDTVDAVAELSQVVSGSSPTSVKVSALWAYASGGYLIPEAAALSEEELVSAVCSAQLSDGGFAFSGSVSDADMTAMVINALLPYVEKDEKAKDAVGKARRALHALQHDDGTWGSGVQTTGNANSTAFAVIALCALGEDPAKPLAGSKVAPLDALLSFAAPENDGFLYNGNLNALATEQGFRALIAYRGFKSVNGSYNIYTQASKAIAAFKQANVDQQVEKADAADDASSAKDETKAIKEKRSKKTQANKAEKKRSNQAKAPAVTSQVTSGSSFGGSSISHLTASDFGSSDESDGDSGLQGEGADDFSSFIDGANEEFTDGSADVFSEVSDANSVPAAISNKTAWGIIVVGILMLILAAVLWLYWSYGRKTGR